MFNDILTLIGHKTEKTKALSSNRVPVETDVLCEVRSATRNEFYNYGDSELRPEYVVSLNLCEYSGQDEAKFREKKYKITRVFEDGRDTIELTLSRKIGG